MIRRGLLLALLLLGTARAGGPGIEELVRRFGDPRTRLPAYRELLAKKDPRAVFPLLGLLPKLDPSGQVYGAAVLGAIGTREAFDALRTLTRLGDPHLRVTAGAALYAKGDRGAVLSMADALLTEGIPPRVRVLMVLRVLNVKELPVQMAVAQMVRPGADASLLHYSLYFLSRQEAREVADCAEGLLQDPRKGWRAIAAAFLLRFGREEHAEVAAKVLREEGLVYLDWVRFRSYLLLARRVPSVILDALAERLPREPDRRVLLQMISFLSNKAHRKAGRPLRKLLEGDDPDVARAAFDALLRTPGGLGPDRLHLLLSSDSPALRLRAVDALRRHDDRSGLPVALRLLSSDSAADRAEAARTVGRFRRSEVVSPLIRMLADPDPAVRRTALSGLTATFAVLFPYRRFRFELTGYRPEAKPAENEAAIAAIRDWWERNRTADW